MIVVTYRIRGLHATKNTDAEQSLKGVLFKFRQSLGCLGLRLLVSLEDPAVFVAVSYWDDARTHSNAKRIHVHRQSA